ncbi:MAG TPA: ABC transporter permease [Actinocrinis sp.]|jgi:oleandomycin transport system permease protein
MSAVTLTPGPISRAGDTQRHVPLRSVLRHTGSMVRRNLLTIKADPEELADVTIFPLMMTVLFTYVFGGAMKGSLKPGENYLEFLIPGIITQMLTFGTVATGMKLNQDFDKGVIDRFRSLPIARSAVINGHIVASMLRLVLAMVFTLAVSFALGFRIHTNPLAALGGLGVVLALGFGVSWLFVYMGAKLSTPAAMQGVGQMVLFPLMFASSIFAPTSSMPGWLQSVVKINPLTNAADAARALMIGEGGALHPTLITLGWAVGFAVVFGPLAVRAYKNRK